MSSDGSKISWRRAARTTFIVITSCILLLPLGASAHVKWFCSMVNVEQPPVALADVMMPVFLLARTAFLFMVFAGFIVDGIVARKWPRLASSGQCYAVTEEKFAAAGICLLYAYGIARFGIFHMTDYVFFPGIAAYFALTAVAKPEWLRLRVPVLSGALAFSVMWTAVEKFVYPQWTLFIIAEHPNLSLGFPWGFTTVMAGFVEFTLAFYFMTGRGLVRFGAPAYASIFIAAIPEFGHLDSVGHLPIVGILAVVCLRGHSPLQRLMGVLERGAVANAAAISALYLVTLERFQADWKQSARSISLFDRMIHMHRANSASFGRRTFRSA